MLPPYLLKFHIIPSCGKDDFDFALRADYAAGIKQSRDPKYANVPAGAAAVYAQTNPAAAPSAAAPRSRGPREESLREPSRPVPGR